MTLAKGQGSSRRKRKEIASNDTATQDVGEEAAHSESDRSDEKEAWHDLDNKCAPFIDPWYDTHAYLLKVPGKYSLLGRVWLALCHHNMDISWALLASSILDLAIH